MRLLGNISVLVLVAAGFSASAQENAALQNCRQLPDVRERLACYDQLADDANRVQNMEVRAREQALAAPVQETQPSPQRRRGIPGYLSADGSNFLGIVGSPQFPEQGELGERTRMEIDLSVKYPLFDWETSFHEESGKRTHFKPDRLFFIYNGSYDFHYLNSISFLNREDVEWYDSSPVVSKSQNPGVVAEWDLNEEGVEKFRFGIFHHSNGQTFDFDDPNDPDTLLKDDPFTREEAAEVINGYIDGPEGKHYALEQISRSSYYVQLRYQKQSDNLGYITPGYWQYQLELRPYYPKFENEMFWDGGREENPEIRDYDGIRGLWEKYWGVSGLNNHAVLMRAELKTGLSGFENLSGKLSLGWKWGNWLLSGYWFNGYGKELSTYHLRSHHLGIGLEFR